MGETEGLTSLAGPQDELVFAGREGVRMIERGEGNYRTDITLEIGKNDRRLVNVYRILYYGMASGMIVVLSYCQRQDIRWN